MCIADLADLREEQFLQDCVEPRTDEDLLEEHQREVLKQQEEDLRRMQNNRSLKSGNFLEVVHTAPDDDFLVVLLMRCYVMSKGTSVQVGSRCFLTSASS